MKPALAAQLTARGLSLSLPPEHIVFHQGDGGDCMYAIVSGRVQIYMEDSEGHRTILNVLGAGEFFGEMALLDGRARSASAITLESCELLQLERDAFLDLIATSQEIRSQLLSELTGRIRVIDERYLQEEIARQTLRAEVEKERHRALAQMVAGVAHEVNTPLGIINTAASIMKRELASDTAAALAADPKTKALFDDLLETVDLMQKNTVRAHGLIQSFKNLSVNEIVETKETSSLPDL
ncbi:MAG TPA: cyclic nucleotide-binding domain-containing protein, partial [Terriglobia bacterium]|nr:cyclic nucleotide-binding domain-containing protein [Terriglobia bacterium]